MAYRAAISLGVFSGPGDRIISHRALHHLLEALVRIDIDYLRANPNTPEIYRSGIRYHQDILTNGDDDDWQDIPTILRFGYGDCEDLACWRTAELIVRHNQAAEPLIIWKEDKDGSQLYHILVLRPDGQIEDPSKTLGM